MPYVCVCECVLLYVCICIQIFYALYHEHIKYMYTSIIVCFILGGTGSVNCISDSVYLYHPSPVQCEKVINELDNNHKKIILDCSSTHSTLFLLASPQLHSLKLRTLEIVCTPLPNDCIQYLCQLLTVNKSIRKLAIMYHSISDSGIASICQTLQQKSSLTTLHLYYNPLITSASAQSIYHLLLNNSVLSVLDLSMTSLSSESVLLLLHSLSVNKKIKRLELDEQHKNTCIKSHLNYHLIQVRVEWWY